MIRKLTIFLAFFTLFIKAPIYPYVPIQEEEIIQDPCCPLPIEYEEVPCFDPLQSDPMPDPMPPLPPLDQNGNPIFFDQNGNRIPLDKKGDPIFVDRNGNRIPLDENGNPMPVDRNGNRIPLDQYGNPVPLDQNGCPMPPPPIFDKNGCPIPPGACHPFNKCDPKINPYAPPPEGVCCPPAPIRGAHWGLNAATMILPIMLIVGVAAIILTEHSETAH